MKLRIGLVAGSLFAAVAASPVASAMPVAPAPHVSSDAEHVRWVCDPWGRCGWRPNYYYGYGYAPYSGPRYYGPRYYGPRYYGYRRW